MASTKNTTATNAVPEVINPLLLERSQPDKPIHASSDKNPRLYPSNIPDQSIFIMKGSTAMGSSGCSKIINRQDAITATSKLQAASADAAIIQLTDFFDDTNTTMVIRMVAEIPPKNALTKDNCSATATMYLGFNSDIG